MVLRLRREAPNWNEAKCRGTVTSPDEDPFFGGPTEDPVEMTAEMEEARAFCNGEVDGVVCPLREACLTFALSNNEHFGVWGGTSEEDRRAIRKKFPWTHDLGGDIRPEWHWYVPGEVMATLSEKERAAIRSPEPS